MKPICAVDSLICACLYIIYRSYRGFFVIVPAVYSETVKKLRAGVIDNEENADVDPSTGKLRIRSSFLISCVSIVVTAIFALKTVGSWAWAVLTKIFHKLGITKKTNQSNGESSVGNVALSYQ